MLPPRSSARGRAVRGLVLRRDVADFAARARPWLLEREAEHNLVLGILDRLEAGDHTWEEPIWLATVEEDGRVVGCAWRTPPHKAGLTRMPAGCPELVADAMAEVYPTLPAVLAEEAVAHAFARRWSVLRDVPIRTGMRMRIHALEAVGPPPRPAPGSLRRAVPEVDRERVHRWWTDFCAEAGIPERESDPAASDRRMARGELWLWEDGGPVCLVGISGRSPNGARIGPVYTPPEQRGKGYGTTATAAVTAVELDAGARLCFLYTDLSNPTSNAIYGAIGYRPVCDVVDLHFEDGG